MNVTDFTILLTGSGVHSSSVYSKFSSASSTSSKFIFKFHLRVIYFVKTVFLSLLEGLKNSSSVSIFAYDKSKISVCSSDIISPFTKGGFCFVRKPGSLTGVCCRFGLFIYLLRLIYFYELFSSASERFMLTYFKLYLCSDSFLTCLKQIGQLEDVNFNLD